MLAYLGITLLLWLTYQISRYTTLVHACDAAFQASTGTCCHEHSLYDVERAYRRLTQARRVYGVLVVLIVAGCLEL